MSDEDAVQDQNAPPEDGSQKGEGGWKPPSDGSWIPKARFDEAVNEARGMATRVTAEAETLRARVQALEAEKAKPEAVKPLSRMELNQLVADGKITQDGADAHMDLQAREAAKREGRAEAEKVVTERERESVVKRQLGEYRKLVPMAWEDGSKDRAKAEREFQALREMGFPDNKVTEVAALRAAFGDPEVIKASRSTGRTGPGETHVDVGGSERPGASGTEADGAPKGLTEREKAHYTDKINKGIYKDWKAVAEERKFARSKQA